MWMTTEDYRDEGQGILAWSDNVNDELSITVWMDGGVIWLQNLVVELSIHVSMYFINAHHDS